MKFLDYFTQEVEYPDDVASNPLPLNVWWSYISSTFLNGFINYVDPIKVFVLDRYTRWTDDVDEISIREPPGAFQWSKFKGTKEKVLELASEEGRVFHASLKMFDDDVVVLSRPKKSRNGHQPGGYVFFWFDCDVSDCCIGRFETEDSEEDVVAAFVEWVEWVSANTCAQYGGEGSARELPPHALSGWVSF